MHLLLIHLCRNNSLCINASKTKFLNFGKSDENDDASFTITDDQGKTINQKKTIKVLGYRVNKENTLENHISALAARITGTYQKIKGALPFLTPKIEEL